jgi:hypothetical protein
MRCSFFNLAKYSLIIENPQQLMLENYPLFTNRTLHAKEHKSHKLSKEYSSPRQKKTLAILLRSKLK